MLAPGAGQAGQTLTKQSAPGANIPDSHYLRVTISPKNLFVSFLVMEHASHIKIRRRMQSTEKVQFTTSIHLIPTGVPAGHIGKYREINKK